MGEALRAALAGRGWVIRQPPQPRGAGVRTVLVVADDTGVQWPPLPHRPEHAIGIGSAANAAALLALAQRGAVVLNQDVPFLTLLDDVEAALDEPAGRRPGVEAASRLRVRLAEARALAELTARERAVLCGLVHGLGAADIAAAGSRSLTTVRSQIQSVLRRLGVRSQSAAVAVAHRSGGGAGLGRCLETLHQF